ncbi:autotransporter [Paraburkholderia bryophila]|uniref:autotransporter n=1 Tax=Paraburkholderia bryophila TaxID=420952 RepID=UPI0023490826|nr:autotransporter [Paraburkholderia bryophila]WCM24400.1 autotransporter [Paraburkholderia bryophila]
MAGIPTRNPLLNLPPPVLAPAAPAALNPTAAIGPAPAVQQQAPAPRHAHANADANANANLRHALGAAPRRHNPAAPLVPDAPTARMGTAVARTAARLRTSKLDVSTALYQSSRQGKPLAPASFKADGERYERKPAVVSTTAGTPLLKGAQQAHEVLGKFGAHAAAPLAAADTAHALHLNAAMDGAAGLTTYLDREFAPGPRDQRGLDPLSARLAGLGAAPGSPATTRGALVAHALRQANVADAGSAHAILDALGGLDFAHMESASARTPAEAHAWLTARVLSRTTEGFDALEQLRTVGAGADLNLTPTQRQAHRVMLQAADKLDPHPGFDPAPATVAAREAPPAGGSLLEAPLAWQAYHAALTLRNYGSPAMTPDQKGAYFAWQQNFREDGPGTDLARARERLRKFSGETIDRTAKNRWKTLPSRLIGHQKSPLSALNMGTQGVPRVGVAAERAALVQAMQVALQATAPELTARPELSAASALRHARPEQSLAELATLHAWVDSGGFPDNRIDATRLGEAARHAQRLCAALQPDDVGSAEALDRMKALSAQWAQTDPHELARSKPFKSIVNQSFDHQRLAAWGKVAGIARESPFWTRLEALSRAADPRSDAIDSRDRDAVRDGLKTVATQLQSSARLRLTDGGRVGVSTRGLSANLGKVLHSGGVPFAPRLDLRASRTREAVVELSRATQGVEMFIGTAKTRALHAGAGALVGYDVDVGLTQLRAGVVMQGVLHSEELVEPSGVSLRFARRVNERATGYDDNRMREKLDDLIDHVFDETTRVREGAATGARGTWNRLAEHCFDDPDVSVSWTDTVARSVKQGGSVDATLSAKLVGPVKAWRAGANLGVGYEKTRTQTLDSNETSGRLQVEQHRSGAGSRLLGRLSGTLGASIAAGSPHTSVAVGITSFDAPAATLTFQDNSRLSKVQLVRENGTLVHRACLLDTEYSSASTYTEALDASRPQWVALLAAEIAEDQQAARALATRAGNPPPVFDPPRRLAEQRLDSHLGDVKTNRRPNQTWFHRYRLSRGAAVKIDVLNACAKQGPAGRAALDAEITRILDNPASWLPAELKVKERTTSARNPGLNAGVQLNARTTATGDRELFSLSIPFALADRLDDEASRR